MCKTSKWIGFILIGMVLGAFVYWCIGQLVLSDFFLFFFEECPTPRNIIYLVTIIIGGLLGGFMSASSTVLPLYASESTVERYQKLSLSEKYYYYFSLVSKLDK